MRGHGPARQPAPSRRCYCRGTSTSLPRLKWRNRCLLARRQVLEACLAARQFINHGHVKVNGVRVNIGSFRCKAGDVIECFTLEEVKRTL